MAEPRRRIICIGLKPLAIVVGYTNLGELAKNQDPEVTRSISRMEGRSGNWEADEIAAAIRRVGEGLRIDEIAASSVRDFVDDRFGVVGEIYKQQLMDYFK